MSSLSAHNGLAKRRLGTVHLLFFTVSASAPMTVLAGGVVGTFAVTGSLGVPLSFPILALALSLFAVGYAAMSRYVANAGAFYAYLAQGLGRAWGVSASFVALVAYNAINIGLYGLFGWALAGFLNIHFGDTTPWWIWSFAVLALVAILGLLRVDLNARVLAVMLLLEIVAVILFDFGAIGNPAHGLSSSGFHPGDLFGDGAAGGVFAFGIAAFIGFESGAIYCEEVKNPKRTVARATFCALAFTGVLYAISAWALEMGAGPNGVVAAARDPESAIPFSIIAANFGESYATGANVLFLTSVFAAILSFHNGVARYLFALGRERVLPAALGRTGVGSGAPVAGSLITSLLALAVVSVFVLLRRDPFTELFTWWSYMAAVGVVLLMFGTTLSVIGFFRKRDGEENMWQRLLAPALGAIALGAVLFFMLNEVASMLGDSAVEIPALKWILPAVVGLAALIGLCWGLVIRNRRPDVYQGIGRGPVDPLTMEFPESPQSLASPESPESPEKIKIETQS